MLRFIFRRAAVGVLVLVAVAILTFALTNAAVDPARAIAGDSATADDIRAIRELYGFDRPLHIQFLAWAQDIIQGDLGQSYRQRRPVSDVVLERLPVTMILGATAFLLAVVVAIPLGILAGLKPNSWIDRCALTIAVLGQAVPNFWLALMGIVIFSVQLRLLPASGSGTWQSFVLPSVALAYYAMPTLMRLTRAGMIDTLQSDYVRTARAKGLTRGQALRRHAVRNAMIPVLTIIGLQFSFLLAGVIIIENVFFLPGLGRLVFQAISSRDLIVVESVVMFLVVAVVMVNFVVDLTYAWVDPRLRGRR